jgi:hypothetical protein
MMLPSEQDLSAGRGKALSPAPEPAAPGSHSGMDGPPAVLTLHERLSELVARPKQGAWDRAGLGDVRETNLLATTALMRNRAPVEMVRRRPWAARPVSEI